MSIAGALTTAQPGENRIPFASRDLVEFGVAYALILAAIWTLNPWQRFFYWAAIAWVVVTTWQHRTTMEGAGARSDRPGAFALDHWGGSDTWRAWHSTWPIGSTRFTGSMARRRCCRMLGGT